ncbi:MAG: hypothetical protein ACSHX0_00510 [Akkermansiaceae bacterium]
MSVAQQNKIEIRLKVITALLTVAAFLWGIYTYRDTTKQKLAAQIAEDAKSAETRRIEATRPFLDRQLQLYTEAVQVTSMIATSSDDAEIQRTTIRFEQLYWGELALVERSGVATAMVNFRNELFREGSSQKSLKPLALALAHACRDELASSWNTESWKR